MSEFFFILLFFAGTIRCLGQDHCLLRPHGERLKSAFLSLRKKGNFFYTPKSALLTGVLRVFKRNGMRDNRRKICSCNDTHDSKRGFNVFCI